MARSLLLLAVLSCSESFAPLSSPGSPTQLVVRAVGVGAVRLSWAAVDDPDVVHYVVERRVNHAGGFKALGPLVPQGPQMIVYLDTDVQPATFYGYRVVAVTSFGDRSRPSIVGGAQTPPPPGIDVSTRSESPAPQASDPDGYRVTLAGPDTVSAQLGLRADQRFAPLRAGTYTVTLRGVIDRCEVAADSIRSVVVPDTGVNTIAHVEFNIRCRDPQRSRVAAIVTAEGDSLDDSGFELQLTGIATDGNLPDSLRLFTQRSLIAAAGGTVLFDNLRPGEFEIELRGVDAHCVRDGSPTRTLTGTASSTDTVRFGLACNSQRPDDAGRPLAWRNTFSAAAAAPQSRVFLDIALDATERPGINIAALEGEVRYDATVLRFESALPHPGGGLTATVNGGQSGILSILAIDNNGTGITGLVPVSRVEFTVVGAAGRSVGTRTRVSEVVDASFNVFTDSTRAVEDTLVVATGAPLKQPPVANAHGPYSGVAGNAVTFNSTGSTDPDGGPVTYRWVFGDGSESTLASPSKAYASANSYNVTLTVTDDEGVTASANTTATISSGGSNQPPVANANGPYSGVAGTQITFSSAGSSDPDGGAVTYRWNFGDGSAESTVASPAKTYAAAGNYVATLTVTDDEGGSTSAQANVTVTPGASTGPITWSYNFGPVDADSVVAMHVLLDLTADLPETPSIEVLQAWAVDSLKWNPAVLRFHAFNFGQGAAGSVNQTFTASGKLIMNSTQANPPNVGLLTIATIRFKVIGTPGQTSTVRAWVASITNPQSFNYLSRTDVRDGTFVVP